MVNGGQTVPRIEKSEHIGPDDTGDNIMAKRAANYAWDGANWQRQPVGFEMGSSFDDTKFTNPDANGNYQTITYKSSGSTVRTLTLVYDTNNNVTSIVKS